MEIEAAEVRLKQPLQVKVRPQEKGQVYKADLTLEAGQPDRTRGWLVFKLKGGQAEAFELPVQVRIELPEPGRDSAVDH